MKNFKSLNLALAIALASSLTVGCQSNAERASTETEDRDLVSMKKDADIDNRSADKAAVLPRGERTDEDQYSLREDYQLNQERQSQLNQERQSNQQSQLNQETQQNTASRRQQAAIDENETVLFEFDSATLTDEAKESLDELANSVKDKKDSLDTVKIEGYADATGPDAYNDQLSRERANSVKSYLESKGIKAENWNVEGKGEENPTASNDNERGRSENRRVVIEISDENREGYTSSFSPD